MEKTIRNYRIPNIMAVFALVGLVMMAYLRWARPYQLRWGATDEEVQRPMPGDELNPNPKFLATRAITIEGKPQDVWPWLVQMGYRRAGFYGYDILENLGSPRGIRSADRILPEFQHFTVGDEVPISPAGCLVFYAIEPTRYLIWSGRFHLGAVPGGREAYPAGQPHPLEPQLDKAAPACPRSVYRVHGPSFRPENPARSERAGRGPNRAHGTAKHRVRHLPCGCLDLSWGDCLDPSTSAHLA